MKLVEKEKEVMTLQQFLKPFAGYQLVTLESCVEMFGSNRTVTIMENQSVTSLNNMMFHNNQLRTAAVIKAILHEFELSILIQEREE